jgi:glycerophosphoryl diester phosphodiesterase
MNPSTSRLRHRLTLLVLAAALAATLTVTTGTAAEARGLNLHRGSHGAKVRLLESRLHHLGLLVASAVDRRYRQATVTSVRRFQRAHHLRATGRVNLRTWNAVARAARARPAPAPRPTPLPAPTGPAPAIVGHRGAVGPDAPENTLASMHRAAAAAAVLEFDLRLTADHQIVLMHDVTLDRTTNCTGRVIDWTLEDLRASCRVGTQPIPTFEEVAAYAGTLTLKIAPEIKNGDIGDADLAKVFAIIDAHDLQGRTIMQSFEPAVLQKVHALRPDLRLMLVSTRPVTVAAARAAYATTVAIRLENLSATDVAGYRRNGIIVWTFTAIDNPTLDQAHRIHADAVITDIPGQAKAHYDG